DAKAGPLEGTEQLRRVSRSLWRSPVVSFSGTLQSLATHESSTASERYDLGTHRVRRAPELFARLSVAKCAVKHAAADYHTLARESTRRPAAAADKPAHSHSSDFRSLSSNDSSDANVELLLGVRCVVDTL